MHAVTKCQFLEVLMYRLFYQSSYIDLSKSEWQHKINIWEGHPALCYTILLYFILSLATVANLVHFACICYYYASILLSYRLRQDRRERSTQAYNNIATCDTFSKLK